MAALFRVHTSLRLLTLSILSVAGRGRFSQFSLHPVRTIMASSSWECSRCTFLNLPTQRSQCQICLSPYIPPPTSCSSSSSSNWPCKACTFSNAVTSVCCEICGRRPSPIKSSLCNSPSFSRYSTLGSLSDDELDPSVGSVFMPLQRCKRKFQDTVSEDNHQSGTNEHFEDKISKKTIAPLPETMGAGFNSTIKIMSYNIWFREDLEVQKRMEAIGSLVLQHSPDVICFQEVTPNMYDILSRSSWWKEYFSSLSKKNAFPGPYFCLQLSKLPVKAFSSRPFSNSIMGRELCIADIDIQMPNKLVVATSHLESPCPAPPKWDQMFSKERVIQAKEALNILNYSPNTVFCGDMNWDDKLDGSFPLPDGWVDAWEELRPKENGWTYDTKANKMLSANRTLQKRLDRCLCYLRDFELSGIEMFGMEPIPGLSYAKEKRVRKEIQKIVLPVLPSDHYGLLLTIQRK